MWDLIEVDQWWDSYRGRNIPPPPSPSHPRGSNVVVWRCSGHHSYPGRECAEISEDILLRLLNDRHIDRMMCEFIPTWLWECMVNIFSDSYTNWWKVKRDGIIWPCLDEDVSIMYRHESLTPTLCRDRMSRSARNWRPSTWACSSSPSSSSSSRSTTHWWTSVLSSFYKMYLLYFTLKKMVDLCRLDQTHSK